MIMVEWPDGTVDTDIKYVRVFDTLLNTQWQRPPRKRFKMEMARRAKIWSGQRTTIDPDTCARDFFHELSRVGLVKVYEDGIEVTSGQRAVAPVGSPFGPVESPPDPAELPENVVAFPGAGAGRFGGG